MPRLLTRQEAAELLRVSIPTLDKLRLTGQLPFIKFNETVRLVREDVLCFLDRNMVIA